MMKQMKNKTMAMLFALALTLSLVWGINEESRADEASCEHPRCHSVADICLKGHSWSFRKSCADDWANIKCENNWPCSMELPEIE